LIVLTAIRRQLIYHVAVELWRGADERRKLAKSMTVE
jgi:glucosamine 6-phosphate synthetase-like amidotransferase/phosphosugar isomerase protein